MHSNDRMTLFFRMIAGSLITSLSIYSISLIVSLFFGASLKNIISDLFDSTICTVCNQLYTSNSSTLYYTCETYQGNTPSTLTNLMPSGTSSLTSYVQASITTSDTKLAKSEQEESIQTSLESPAEEITETSDNELGIIPNDIYYEDNDEYDASTIHADHVLSPNVSSALEYNQSLIQTLTTSMSRDYLIENFYHVNDITGIDPTIFDVKKLLTKNLTLKKENNKPQILVFHTHAHEAYSDSRPNVREDTVVGVGDVLVKELQDKYGYTVIHSTTQYKYNSAYNSALSEVSQILKENPSIQVVIDLHRDANSGEKISYIQDGKETAKVMFFNGVSYNQKGPITYLKNKNLQSNLAFSLQMKLYAMKHYPELTKKTCLKCYRFNMHQKGRYTLIEAGDNKSKVQEVKNAMIPLADTIDAILTGRE